MRWSPGQIGAIRQQAACCSGADAPVRRADDAARGGANGLARHVEQAAVRVTMRHRQSATRFARRGAAALCRGFTLIEMVMVLVIAGVLAVVALPRMFNATEFQSRGLSDQVQASLRYAQKIAIAQHRFVCATFTANSLSLTIGPSNTCGTPIASLTSNGNYVLNAPSSISFAATPTAFSFDALGQPRTASLPDAAIGAVTVGVTGDVTRTITVEAETGYVHQ